MRLGIGYEHLGRHAEAIAHLRQAVAASNTEWMADLGHVCAVAGRQGEARGIIDQLETLSNDVYVSAYGFATIYAGLGEQELAFEWLEKAHEERSWFMPFIRVEPEMDPLRSDPRFQDIVRRMNFPGAVDR